MLGRSPWLRVGLALFAVGYGANQFAPLLLVYRRTDHLTETVVTAMFGAYALGLIPALLGAALLAGRWGHRAVLRPVMVLAIVGSVVLAVGHSTPWLLYLGRVLYGLATGAAMAPGTTWIKELSAGAPAGTGARRAAMSLSAGFAGGPLIAGFIAEYLPAPTVLPYLVHIALMGVVAAIAWNAPQPAPSEPEHVVAAGEPAEPLDTQSPAAGAAAVAGRHFAWSGRFWWGIAPMAPWVFSCATLSLVVGPSLVLANTGGFTVAFSGLMAGITLGVGVAVQQPARHAEARRPGVVSVAGMVAAVLGTLLLIPAARTGTPGWVVLAGVVLGCAYGWVLVGGLTRVEQLSRPGELAMSNAVFYCLTYLGFAVPTVVSLLRHHFSITSVLLGTAVLAALCGGFGVAALRR
nr:MFS transporter [Nakamurella aerolata]